MLESTVSFRFCLSRTLMVALKITKEVPCRHLIMDFFLLPEHLYLMLRFYYYSHDHHCLIGLDFRFWALCSCCHCLAYQWLFWQGNQLKHSCRWTFNLLCCYHRQVHFVLKRFPMIRISDCLYFLNFVEWTLHCKPHNRAPLWLPQPGNPLTQIYC